MTKVKVLCLHRITDTHYPSWPGMSLKVFERLLKHLVKKYHICLPSELKEITKKQQLIITFDDGFEDFYTNAFPLLQKFGVKAVLNVVVKCITDKYQIWTQRLNDVVDAYANNNKTISFNLKGNLFEFPVNIHLAETASLKIYRILLPLDINVRNGIIDGLEKNAPISVSKSSMLNIEQLIELSENGIIIGSHSMSHPNLQLESFSDTDYCNEIVESRKALQLILNKPVECFAFPNGMYSNKSISTAIEAGYQYLFLINNRNTTFKAGLDYYLMDRILIYSNNHWKNLFRLYNLHQILRKR